MSGRNVMGGPRNGSLSQRGGFGNFGGISILTNRMAPYTRKALPSEADLFHRSPGRTISRRSVRFVAEGNSTSGSQHASSRSAVIESLSPPTDAMGQAHHAEYRLQILGSTPSMATMFSIGWKKFINPCVNSRPGHLGLTAAQSLLISFDFMEFHVLSLVERRLWAAALRWLAGDIVTAHGPIEIVADSDWAQLANARGNSPRIITWVSAT
jgi:hypothetical protein